MTAAGTAMAERFLRGGRLYTLGNGGSSTDAATLATLFSRPARGRPVAAWSLAADEAVVTALGNDVGFELIFKRQIIAHGRDRDVAVALSTSGNSEDLMTAITEAKQRGLLTIGFSGHDGGRMADLPTISTSASPCTRRASTASRKAMRCSGTGSGRWPRST